LKQKNWLHIGQRFHRQIKIGRFGTPCVVVYDEFDMHPVICIRQFIRHRVSCTDRDAAVRLVELGDSSSRYRLDWRSVLEFRNGVVHRKQTFEFAYSHHYQQESLATHESSRVLDTNNRDVQGVLEKATRTPPVRLFLKEAFKRYPSHTGGRELVYPNYYI